MFKCLVAHHAWSSPPVWPDWAIFKVFGDKYFLAKVTQMCEDFLGYFESINFQVKLPRATFWETFEELGLFLFQHMVTLNPPFYCILFPSEETISKISKFLQRCQTQDEKGGPKKVRKWRPQKCFLWLNQNGGGVAGGQEGFLQEGGGVLTIVTRYGYTLKGD